MPKERLCARIAGAFSRGRTVRLRVLTVMMAFMTVGLAVTGVLTYAAQFRALEQRVNGELWQEHSELILIAESDNDDGTPVHTTVDSVLLQATESAAPSDYESVVTFIDDQPLYQPRVQDFALLPPDSPETPQVLERLLASHQPQRSVIVPLEAHGRELQVLVASVNVEGDEAQGIFVVANDIGAQRLDLWQSVFTFAGLSVITLLIAGWVGYVVTGRLLRPLEDLRAATEQITVDDLEYRVPVPEGRDDIAALAQNFNRMLARIQAGFAEQRRFMSDVGHELRTPLTIVRGTLETTDVEDVRTCGSPTRSRSRSSTGWAGSWATSRSCSLRAPRLRAAQAPRSGSGSPAPSSRASSTSRSANGSWSAASTWSPTPTSSASPQAVVQLAANAVRYSEEGSRIRFGVGPGAGTGGPEIHVTVQDEGIGIGPADQRRIFERFTRVDGSRGSGSGLGLPIVLAIAEGHDGVVRLLSKPGRGSTFTIVFPQFADRTPTELDGPSASAGDTERQGRGPEDDTTTAPRRDEG